MSMVQPRCDIHHPGRDLLVGILLMMVHRHHRWMVHVLRILLVLLLVEMLWWVHHRLLLEMCALILLHLHLVHVEFMRCDVWWNLLLLMRLHHLIVDMKLLLLLLLHKMWILTNLQFQRRTSCMNLLRLHRDYYFSRGLRRQCR